MSEVVTNMFKIKHVATGQYVKKSAARWSSNTMILSGQGKTWNSIGAVKGHIRLNEQHYSKHGNDYELVELKVTEADGCKVKEILTVMNNDKAVKEENKKKKKRDSEKLRLLKAQRENLDTMIKEMES